MRSEGKLKFWNNTDIVRQFYLRDVSSAFYNTLHEIKISNRSVNVDAGLDRFVSLFVQLDQCYCSSCGQLCALVCMWERELPPPTLSVRFINVNSPAELKTLSLLCLGLIAPRGVEQHLAPNCDCSTRAACCSGRYCGSKSLREERMLSVISLTSFLQTLSLLVHR